MAKLEWKEVPEDEGDMSWVNKHFVTYRAAVPGGWLVRAASSEVGAVTQSFVPDPDHTWQ